MFDRVTCNKCKNVKLRKDIGGHRYVDELGLSWRYNMCPGCAAEYRRGRKPRKQWDRNGVCEMCSKAYEKRHVGSLVCSEGCKKEKQKLLMRRVRSGEKCPDKE